MTTDTSALRCDALVRIAAISLAQLFWISSAVAAEPLKIGAILATTGPTSFTGDPEEKTLRLYVDRINAAGGADGRKIELTIYDDGGDAAKANTYARRLVQQDQVDLIIGPSNTGPTMAILPLIEASKIPVISLGAGGSIVNPVKPSVFNVVHSERLAAVKLLDDVKARGITSVAVLSDTGGYGKGAREQFLDYAKTAGIRVVSDETYGDRDPDMTPQLTHARQAYAGALVVLGSTMTPAIIAKNYRQLGLTMPLYLTHGQASYEFMKIAGHAANGIRMPSPALLVAETLPSNDPQRKISVDYKNAYETKYGSSVSTFGGYSYDALMLALDAVKRAGSTDREKIRQALEQTQGFTGVTGIFTMSPSNHNGLTPQAFKMVEIRDGKFVNLDK